MAKTISDEKMKLSIIIDGNDAQKSLYDLEKNTRSLTEANRGLLLQKKELEKQGKKDSDAYRELTATMKTNSLEITTNKTKMKELQDQIGLTGLTMKQLSDKALVLKLALRNAIPGGEAHQRYTQELQQVQARLDEVSGRARQTGMSIGSLADSFNRYQGMVVSFLAVLTGVVFSIQKIIDVNSKLSDAMADVQKTTGMTKEEVEELAKSFGLLHTRTSRADLLGIAKIGGKLGIAKEEIGNFVKVMDKASIALGEDFSGGAEEVADKLGKIKNLYGELRNAGVEHTFEAVGSALNDLGAEGTASEANVAEFVTRVGSMPEAFKPSIATALGLGAAFEESGINAEKAGSNYSKVITLAANNVAGFAKQMGKPKKAIEDLINTNPNEFFLQFSESLKGLSGTDLANVLDKLKLNDNEVKQVLGAASTNTDLFREKIDLANKSMNKATSLTNEATIKNTNFAAILEKLSKTISGWFSSETFVKWLASAVDWIARFVGATEDADGSVTAWRNTLVFTAKILAIVTATIITNVGWVQLCAMWTNRNTEATLLYNIAAKARAFADGVAMVASQAYAIVTALLTGNIVGATQAFRVMTATMMTTPWGFILGAVAAIGAAYVLFRDNVEEANVIQKTFNDINTETNKSISKQKTELELLTKVAQNKNLTDKTRLDAIKKLNEIIPDHIGLLTLENIKTFEGIEILKKYTAELYANARAKAVKAKFDKLAEERVDVESKTAGDYRKEQTFSFLGDNEFDNLKSREEFEKAVAKKYKGTDKAWQKLFVEKSLEGTGLEDKINALKTIDTQMKALEAELLKTPTAIINPNENTVNTKNNLEGDSITKKDPNSTTAEINRLKLEENQKFNDALLKQQRQMEDDRIASMEEGYAKELAIENQRYQREIDDLNRQKIHTQELAKLDEEISKAKESKDIAKYNALLDIKKGWQEKNLALDAQVNQIILGKLANHNKKLSTIQEKAATEEIKKKKEEFDREKLQRELKYNEELAALGNNKKAKEKLTKKFNQDELNYQEEYLKELIDSFNSIVGDGVFNEIDLSLLSPEQVQKFTDEAAKVGLTLAELINKKNELKGSEEVSNAQALGVSGGNADVFGFTPENWDTLFVNLEKGKFGINEMIFAVTALTNAFSMYSQFVETNEKQQLATFEKNTNSKKNKYKQQLDSGKITQEQYNKFTEKADTDLANKKAEIENKQAKRQKAIAISNIAMSTAQAILGIWAQFPKFDFGATAAIMTGVVGALGAAQIAMVLRQPLPSATGYEDGLYSDTLVKREQDGKVFKSRYAGKTRSGLVSKTSHFMVAENGPEMVIDNKAWKQMDPGLKESLIRELNGIKGFEKGYYKNDKLYTGDTPTAKNTSDINKDALIIAMLSQNLEVLTDLRDNPIMAMMSNKDLNSMKNIKEGLAKYEAIRNDNKL